MRSRISPGAGVAVLVLLLVVPSTAARRSAGTDDVVVLKTGLIGGGSGSNYFEYGLVLRNTSLTTDALDVAVRINALNSRGHVFATDDPVVTVIPAGAPFVVAGALVSKTSTRVARLRVRIHVGRTLPRGRSLPTATAVTVTNGGRDVTASLTNPYQRPLPVNATIYGVLLDGHGRIVAGATQPTDAVIKPGQTLSFDLSGNLSTSKQAASVKSAAVSLDPCGPDAFTPACPVPGASS